MIALLLACAPGPATAPPVDLRSTERTTPAPWIPPQCYARTRPSDRNPADGEPRNPCWTCHQQPRPPNFVADADLQLVQSLPAPAAELPWTHLLAPAAPVEDDLLEWVGTDNWRGGASLALDLADLPPEWDLDGDGVWSGYRPDAALSADPAGWDLAGTGWRAYAYWPLPGAFWPTNGSWGDAWIRLPPALRPDPETAALNLAILEAVITRREVEIGPTDEARIGVDLDRDGVLGRATRVVVDWAPRAGRTMAWVGPADGVEPPTPGLYPVGTELLHSVRYLQPTDDGRVRMAPRLKELRYAVKTSWQTWADLELAADGEAWGRQRSPDALRQVLGDPERGLFTGTGWRLQGFVEDAAGELRPQTWEETAFCVGCHGGIGATVDSTFSFARKVPGEAGWRHDPEGLYGLPDRVRADGRGEAALYLETARAGDDFGANDEVLARFFPGGALEEAAVAGLRADLSPLIVPSPARALALDAAYRRIVRDQSYPRGRDAVGGLTDDQVQRRVDPGAPTGVAAPVAPEWVHSDRVQSDRVQSDRVHSDRVQPRR